MRAYIVEAPEHDYDSVRSALIMADDETDAKLQFREIEYAGEGRLEVTDVTEKLGSRGVLHTDFHDG